MDILRIVVNKRSEDKVQKKDSDKLGRFASRVSKLRGEGPEATSREPEVALEVVSINIQDIEVPPNYARKSLGDVTPLVSSIKIFGIQQPLKVVKLKGSKKFRLVFGRRRLKAAELAGLDAVPCIVELVTIENRLHMLSLAENLHRIVLSPIELGDTYQQLLNQNIELAELEKNLGISGEVIKEAVTLLSLPAAVRKDTMNNPERFSFAMLQILLNAFQRSKIHGKKLFNAIVAGEVTSSAEAKTFIDNL